MLVKTYGSAVAGIDAYTITIEVNVSQGIKFFIVGLPDNAVKESEQRMQSALKMNGFKWMRKLFSSARKDLLGMILLLAKV